MAALWATLAIGVVVFLGAGGCGGNSSSGDSTLRSASAPSTSTSTAATDSTTSTQPPGGGNGNDNGSGTTTTGTTAGNGTGSTTTVNSSSPRFGGVTDITTKGAGAAISFVILTWKPASDDQTPRDKIVYEVYTASRSGGENFGHPVATTPPGSTFYRAICSAKYYVVRARDQAGNLDSNTVEKHLSSCPL